MKKIIQVHISRGEQYYVAECVDLPVVTQAKTLDELAMNIHQAIALHLEGEDLSELGLSPDPLILATVELEPAHAYAEEPHGEGGSSHFPLLWILRNHSPRQPYQVASNFSGRRQTDPYYS